MDVSTEKTIILDSEFKQFIPPLSRDEYSALEAEIMRDGCNDSLKVWRTDKGDILIDGYNRHEICTEYGIHYQVEVIAGIENRTDVKKWMINNQFARRNLNQSQKSMLATRLAGLENGQTQSASPIGETSQSEAAEMLNVGKRSVERARKVMEHGIQELSLMVSEGTVSVSAAADVANLPEDEQETIVEGGPEAVVAASREIRNNKKAAAAPESEINADGVIHCAQCGTSAKVVKDFDIFQGVRYYVICENEDCCVQTCMRKKREEVIEIWNKRVK